MCSFAQVLFSVVLLSSVVLGLPAAQEASGQPVGKFGFPLNDDNDRIYGGREASVGQFPYQASLKSDGKHDCGGSIISDRFILTAGHCIGDDHSPSRFRVDVGAHNILQSDGVSYEVKQVIVHEDFKFEETIALVLHNDIALIETTISIAFNEMIAPIALQLDFVNGSVQAVTSGWGESNDQIGNLKYVEYVTMSNADCHKVFAGLPIPVHDWETICARSQNGNGFCHGDSGGPLVSENKLIGINSWMYTCGDGNPDGFTRVGNYIDWISEKTKISF